MSEADPRVQAEGAVAAPPEAAPVLAKLEEMGIGFNADILHGISNEDRATALRVLARIRGNIDQIEQGIGQAS